ncbi:unnamed protein product [Malus baccata var. baccata]
MLQEISDETLVSTICVGNQIPHWFCHQNKGSSITIKLPPDWYGTDFLGFAFSLVVADNAIPFFLSLGFMKIVCKCNFKTNSGQSHEVIYPSFIPFTEGEGKLSYLPFEFIFVWYSAFALRKGANLNRSTSFYKLVTEACFEFNAGDAHFGDRLTVKRCGISLLYAQDVDTIKLWTAADVYQVLGNDTGTSTVQCISFDTSNITRLELCGSPFKKMSNLGLLMIHDPHLRVVYNYSIQFGTELVKFFKSLPNSLRYLYWLGYPLKSLPSNFSPQNLVELRMPGSFVGAKLWSKNQNLGNLKVIELSFCTHLTEVPDLSRISSSRNSLTQAWDKYELFRGRFNFVDCRNLDENARTNIMADTQLRIMRVATGPLKTQQHKEEEIVMVSLSLSHPRTH